MVTAGEPVKFYVPIKEIFDVIETTHVAVGHGSRERLRAEVSKKIRQHRQRNVKCVSSVWNMSTKKSTNRKGIYSLEAHYIGRNEQQVSDRFKRYASAIWSSVYIHYGLSGSYD